MSISRVQSLDRSAAGFFVVEALKTVKKPLKTAKNRKIFQKRDPKNFSPAAGFFSKKSSVDLTKVLGQSRGGVKNIFHPPPHDGV